MLTSQADVTRVKRNKKRKAATDKNKTKRRNKTEIFLESLKQSYTSYKIWTDRCIGRNKAVLGE